MIFLFYSIGLSQVNVPLKCNVDLYSSYPFDKIGKSLPKGTIVTVINKRAGGYVIEYQDITAEISIFDVVESKELKEFIKNKKIEKAKLRKEEEKRKKERIKKEQDEWERQAKIEQDEWKRQQDKWKRQAKIEQDEWERQAKIKRQQREKRIIETYSVFFWNTIINNQIQLGMTKEMVIDSWGRPDDINRTVGSWGVHEQWVYERNKTYLYFENGILTSWQD